MDQLKIGRFIAELRKERQLTQRQLAQMLGVSDKTISKWETGNGMPEVSLMLPLCQSLGISVNELLTGERLADTDYKMKAEENMMNLMQEREENKKKAVLTVAIGIISVVSFLTLIWIVATYTDDISLPDKVLMLSIACMIFAVGIYLSAEGERSIGYYKCGNCGKTFVPSFMAYTMGVHLVSVRRLGCPECGKRSWCKKVLTKEDR